MKLVFAIVHNDDAGKLTATLRESGFQFTLIGTTGGFLREGNATIIIGVEANKPDAVASLRLAGGQGVEVESLPVLYPQGAEKQLVKALLGREVPPPNTGPRNADGSASEDPMPDRYRPSRVPSAAAFASSRGSMTSISTGSPRPSESCARIASAAARGSGARRIGLPTTML